MIQNTGISIMFMTIRTGAIQVASQWPVLAQQFVYSVKTKWLGPIMCPTRQALYGMCFILSMDSLVYSPIDL